MSQLAEQLSIADQICSEAYPFFERAAYIRANAEAKSIKDRKTKIIISVIGFLFFTNLLSIIWSIIFKNASAIPVLIGAAAVFFLFKRVFAPQIASEYSASMKTADTEERKGTKILEDNIPALSVIPDDYWYPMATNYLLKMVKTGRADTVNQALQMYDEQLHRWRMEESSAAILAQQQAQTEALKSIRESSAISAAANTVNATANVSRWF